MEEMVEWMKSRWHVRMEGYQEHTVIRCNVCDLSEEAVWNPSEEIRMVILAKYRTLYA